MLKRFSALLAILLTLPFLAVGSPAQAVTQSSGFRGITQTNSSWSGVLAGLTAPSAYCAGTGTPECAQGEWVADGTFTNNDPVNGSFTSFIQVGISYFGGGVAGGCSQGDWIFVTTGTPSGGTTYCVSSVAPGTRYVFQTRFMPTSAAPTQACTSWSPNNGGTFYYLVCYNMASATMFPSVEQEWETVDGSTPYLSASLPVDTVYLTLGASNYVWNTTWNATTHYTGNTLAGGCQATYFNEFWDNWYTTAAC